MRFTRLEHRFCKHIPESLEPGVLYVSMEYGTAVHSCCCGCGEEIVTPFAPTDWKMTFDGRAISLWPSVGNWTLPCRSHYIVREGAVIQARPWTEEEIAAERRRDRAAKARYYGTKAQTELCGDWSTDARAVSGGHSWWRLAWNWVSNRGWQR